MKKWKFDRSTWRRTCVLSHSCKFRRTDEWTHDWPANACSNINVVITFERLDHENAIIWGNMLALNILEYNLDRTVGWIYQFYKPFHALSVLERYRRILSGRVSIPKEMEFIFTDLVLRFDLQKETIYFVLFRYTSVHKQCKIFQYWINNRRSRRIEANK